MLVNESERTYNVKYILDKKQDSNVPCEFVSARADEGTRACRKRGANDEPHAASARSPLPLASLSLPSLTL